MKATRITLLILALHSAAPAYGQTGQLWLLGFRAPRGSMSLAGAGENAVYLRWDTLDAPIPADVVTLRIERDGTLLATLPAHTPMAPSEISALYAGPADARRQAEMIRWLDEATEGMTIDEVTLGDAIAARLADDAFWAYLAARLDIHVARAVRRAWIDESPPAAGATYTLLGADAFGATRNLGEVTVGPDETLAGAASGFRELAPDELQRCDAPAAFKAHGVVALTWAHAGETPVARMATELAVAGYDVYRSVVNAGAAPVRDLRSEALLLPHDPGGLVSFSGLEKVNDLPVSITGDVPVTRLLETHAELSAKGVRPGDQRAYYVVARDFTGNYGATAKDLVKVADLLPPPTPWRIRAHSRALPGRIELRWPEINPVNFLEDHRRRTWCNLNQARFTKRLAWVMDGACPKSAGDGALLQADLDVEKYLIYQFLSVDEARRFADADGDGWSDDKERVDLSAPGDACVPAAVTGPALKATVDASAVVTTKTGRRMVHFTDLGPGFAPGQVVWYRIAAVTHGGRLSPLSAPVRAVYRPVKPPSRQELGDTRIGRCVSRVTVLGAAGSPYLARDTTLRATHVRLSCKDDKLKRVLMPVAGAGVTAELTGLACNVLDCVDDPIAIEYLSSTGRVIAQTVASWKDGQDCSVLNSRLALDCKKAVAIAPGQTIEHPVLQTGWEGDGCLHLYRDIGGKDQRIATWCDPSEIPVPLDVAAPIGSDPVCLSVALSNEDNRVSPRLHLDCFRVAQTSAEAPQPISFAFTEGTARGVVTFRPPEQTVLGTIVEWRRSDGAWRQSTFAPQPAEPALDGSVAVEVAITLPPAPGTTEEWCFRGRSVISRSAEADVVSTLSPWSADRCALRQGSPGPLPEALGWPKVPAIPEGEPLQARYIATDDLPVVRLVVAPGECFMDPCKPNVAAGTCIPPLQVLDSQECEIECVTLQAAALPYLRFVVYRQERDSEAAPASDYVQVSARVDRLHCTTLLGIRAVADPWLSLVPFGGDDTAWSGNQVVFVDRHPHVQGMQYRYQLVSFDVRGEIAGYRVSNWITAEGL